MTCDVGCRYVWDLVLLWLWHRLTAVAPIRPLAWETPHATGVALKRQKTKTNKQTNKQKECIKKSYSSKTRRQTYQFFKSGQELPSWLSG